MDKLLVSFKHSGLLGDIIYSIPAMRAMSRFYGAECFDIYIPKNKAAENHPDIIHIGGTLMFTQAMFDFISPLLNSQDYINSVRFLDEEDIPADSIDFDVIRNGSINTSAGNIKDYYFKIIGISKTLDGPWIKEIPCTTNNKYDIVIGRSTRYLNDSIDYSIIQQASADLSFIGTKNEYYSFAKRYKNLMVRHAQTKTALDALSIICSCNLYIGNQSFFFSLAEACQANRLLEVYEPVPNVIPCGGNSGQFISTDGLLRNLESFYNIKLDTPKKTTEEAQYILCSEVPTTEHPRQTSRHADFPQTQVQNLTAQLLALQQLNTVISTQLEGITRSRSWRFTKPLRMIQKPFSMVCHLLAPGAHGKERRYALARSLYHKLPISARSKRRLRVIGKRLLSPHAEQDYQTWIRRYDTLRDSDREAIHQQIATWENPPKISVIMPVYNAPEKFLRLAIESVREQIYPHWELCIADDASSQPDVRRVLETYAEEDERIKVTYRSENGHISATTNDALALATGDYIALLDHDDTLAEHALYWVASEIVRHPDAALIYSDEDKIDEKGRRCDPYFKPDWNPELLLGQNYISHLGVYKREQVLNIGGFRPGFEGSQDWDLVLRFTDDLDPAQIRHIPAILYHWRILSGSTASDLGAKPYVVDAAKRAITEALERRDEHAILDSACNGAFHLPRFTVVNESPLVSIIIPTRNGLSDLRQCLDSLSRTSYPNTEILIIDNQSDDPETLTYLSEIQRCPDLRVLSYPYPFDYAAMHNWAVPQSRGEYICLLNNDTEVIADRWLTEMLGQGQRRNIGAVGAKLLYPDETIQHGGVILGVGGIAGHAHKSHSNEGPGYFGRAALVQSFSAVTAACLLMRKDLWDHMGGMTPELTVAFNDVDLCLRLREAGLRNVWLPQSLLYHHESRSRGSDIRPDKFRRFALEHAYMQWRWGFVLRNDPAYNPNLTLEREDFSLAWPPRVRHPWCSESVSVEIPYGLPHSKAEPLILPPGGEISGSFAVPVGTRGSLKGISLLIGNYLSGLNGTLVLRLQDADHQTAHAHSTLSSSLDNAMLPLTFSHGGIRLHGQARLFFRLRLEGATAPVEIESYLLDERWGHQILGHEDRALRIALQVIEDDI